MQTMNYGRQLLLFGMPFWVDYGRFQLCRNRTPVRRGSPRGAATRRIHTCSFYN